MNLSGKGAGVVSETLLRPIDSETGCNYLNKIRRVDSEISQHKAKNSLENSSEFCCTCVCLNARCIVNKRNDLNIMVEDINPHVIGITESWTTTDISDISELGMTRYAMFRKDRIGRRGGGVILYIKESIQAYEIKLEKKQNVKKLSGVT